MNIACGRSRRDENRSGTLSKALAVTRSVLLGTFFLLHLHSVLRFWVYGWDRVAKAFEARGVFLGRGVPCTAVRAGLSFSICAERENFF
jgi:hypothetical protein